MRDSLNPYGGCSTNLHPAQPSPYLAEAQRVRQAARHNGVHPLRAVDPVGLGVRHLRGYSQCDALRVVGVSAGQVFTGMGEEPRVRGL